MTGFNLFALTSNPGRRVLRLPLSQDVQLEVTDSFRHQDAAFRDNAQDEITFDGKYKPDDGECLTISDYNDIDDLHDAIANPLSVPEIAPSPVEFSTIKALFSGYKDAAGTKIALVQHFDKRKIISNTGLSLFHSANVYRKVDGIGITLGTQLSAVLEGTTLKFFNFFIVRQIFDLTAHYYEATDADISAFAAIPTIHAPNPAALLEMADSFVRRRVSVLAQSQILQTVPADTIAKAAAIFKIAVQTKEINGQTVIVLPDNKTELKKLLRFLDEDYYQSALLSEPYVSNSKRRLG